MEQTGLAAQIVKVAARAEIDRIVSKRETLKRREDDTYEGKIRRYSTKILWKNLRWRFLFISYKYFIISKSCGAAFEIVYPRWNDTMTIKLVNACNYRKIELN